MPLDSNGLYYSKSVKTITKKAPKIGGSNKEVFLLSYNKFSQSAKALIKALDLAMPRVQDFESAFIGSEGKFKVKRTINWGSGNIPGWVSTSSDTILNSQSAVNICRNKLKFFEAVKDKARVPEILTNLEAALTLVREGKVVMGRKATGSCGTDIVFYEDNADDFAKSEFWSVYKKKKHEFRVHIFRGKVISLQQKALRTSDPEGNPLPTNDIDFRIRNHRNGFVFKRNEINVPDDVITQAQAAFKAISGLDFGAVDVIYNEYENKAYVLEINTAPGLEGTTLEDYVSAFRSL